MPKQVHVDVDNFKVYRDLLLGSQIPMFDVYERAFSRSMQFFSKNSISAVYFVIGEDLNKSNFAKLQLQRAALLGHEIANHTMTHPSNFHILSKEERNREIEECHSQILESLGVSCRSYRAPGYSFKLSDQEKLFQLNYSHNYSRVSTLYTSALNLAFSGSIPYSKKFPGVFENVLSMNRKWQRKKSLDTSTSIVPPLRTGNISTVWFKLSMLNSLLYRLVKARSNSPLLFHIIDFLEYYDTDCKVPALRIPLEKRISLMQSQLDRLKISESSQKD